jgi:hypothetical protein
MTRNHYTTEAEWRRWYAQQMAVRTARLASDERSSSIERKWIQSVAGGKSTGELRYTRPRPIRVKR